MTDVQPTSGQLSETALRRLYPRLRRFAAVVAPAEVAPDDLVQEALERVWMRGTHDIAYVEAFLRQAMMRAASNHRRRLGRARTTLNRFAASQVETEALASYPSDVQFLQSLSPRARAVLFLYEVEGHSFQMVASQLGLTEASVKQIAVRARRHLRHHISHQEGRQ